MTKPLAVFVILLLFITGSCKNADDKNRITSGRIDYKITYLNDDLDKKTRNILPSRMKLMFNEKQAANNIEGFMGMYRVNAYTNFNTRKCSTILKVMDKNYLYKGGREELMCCFDSMDDMEIQETEETKTIAGFLCKKAIVRLPSSDETLTIFYTDKIDLRHANTTNPYKKVKGVLMEFELNLLYLKMHFTAEKYQPLGDYDFTPKLNQNSRLVSRDQMTKILNKLME